MASRYRLIIHLILDSGLILATAEVFELVFFLLSAEPDLTGRTNESFRILTQIMTMIAVSA